VKTLYDGFHSRELDRILSSTFWYPFNDRTVEKLWWQSAMSCQGHMGLWDYYAQPDRYQTCLQVAKLY
jgi:hypothetical protein